MPVQSRLKFALTIALFALRFLRDSGRRLSRPLELFVSADEEVGSVTAHPRMEGLFGPDATALVLEPPLADGSLKLWSSKL